MIIENKSKEVIDLLEFIGCGDNEGDGGDEHHREGEEGEELGEVAGNTKIKIQNNSIEHRKVLTKEYKCKTVNCI